MGNEKKNNSFDKSLEGKQEWPPSKVKIAIMKHKFEEFKPSEYAETSFEDYKPFLKKK